MAASRTNGVHTRTAPLTTSSTIPLWLDGKEVELTSTFDVISPLDQKVLYKASSASEKDAVRAVDAAQKAFKSWSRTKPNHRREIFLRAAELFMSRKDELWNYVAKETGAARSMTAFEHGLAVDGCKAIAGLIQIATTSTSPVVADEGCNALVVKEPYGVVLGIAPWNAPYALGLRACLQPLAMGNRVVLKGSEAAPAAFWAVASVLHEAGLPQDARIPYTAVRAMLPK
ncbi:hypothetical protein LTR67_010218 [Exophiala xenobiotica]